MPGDTNRLSRRRFLTATGGAATMASIAGCSGGNTTETPTEEPTDEPTDGGGGESTDTPTEETPTGGTLQLTLSSMDSLDPAVSIYYSVQEFIGNIFDRLVQDTFGDLHMENMLATDYEVSDDGTTYTFSLKEGVTFHNGADFTADDYVYTFERLAASKNSRKKYILFDQLGIVHETDDEDNYKPGTLGVTAEDDTTLKIELESPYYATLQNLAQEIFGAIPEGLVDDVPGYDGEMSQKEFSQGPVSCGPFEFEKWSSDTEAAVSKFEDYHGKQATVDAVHWQIFADSNAEYTYGMNYNTDIVTIPTAKYDPSKVSVEKTDDLGRELGTYGKVRNGKTLNYLGVTGLGNTIAVFNTKEIPKKVRQAIAYVYNQQLVCSNVYKNRQKPGTHICPPGAFPGGPSAYADHAKKYPYGADKSMMGEAKKLMEEAGYGENNRLEMQFSVWQTSAAERAAKLLRDQVNSIYIDMTVKVAPASQYWGRASTGNFDMYLSGWGMSTANAARMLKILYPPNLAVDPASLEYADWSGTEASEKAKKAWETAKDHPKPTDADEKVRNDAFVTMEEANWEDVALLPISHGKYEQFWYDWLDIPPYGPVGNAKNRYNHAVLDTDARAEQ